jgi:hypothetical protein
VEIDATNEHGALLLWFYKLDFPDALPEHCTGIFGINIDQISHVIAPVEVVHRAILSFRKNSGGIRRFNMPVIPLGVFTCIRLSLLGSRLRFHIRVQLSRGCISRCHYSNHRVLVMTASCSFRWGASLARNRPGTMSICMDPGSFLLT